MFSTALSEAIDIDRIHKYHFVCRIYVKTTITFVHLTIYVTDKDNNIGTPLNMTPPLTEP